MQALRALPHGYPDCPAGAGRIDWAGPAAAHSGRMCHRSGRESILRLVSRYAVVLICLLPHGLLSAASPRWLVLGPMLGHVSESEARVWVKASGESKVSVRISESSDLSRARRITGDLLAESTAFAGTVLVPGLLPDHRYYYAVFLDGKPAMAAPYPSFVTALPPGTKGHLRFAFTSCSGYSAHDPAAGWADLGLRTNLDLILQLGDNHYGNSPRLEKQRAAYLNQRQTASFRDATSRIPDYGIWDDHDFGDNDSDSTIPGREEAFRAFKEHWANPAFGETNNPGVYFKFTRSDVEFFCLDDRYYRSPNNQTNNPAKTMLGPAQLAWVKRGLLESKATVKVLAIGGEWQSNGTSDSWTSFPRERDDILNLIREHNISGVILISGDRHFTAAYHVQKRFIEVTAGPFGGAPAETKNLPEMFINHGKGRFYCLFDIDTRPAQPLVTLEMYQIGIGLIERRTFTWDEVNGQKPIALLGPSPSAAKPAPKP